MRTSNHPLLRFPLLPLAALAAALLVAAGPAAARKPVSREQQVLAPLAKLYPELDALYIDLHRHPELSLQEARTAGKLADRLQALGLAVTRGVGGHGVVGVLRNGAGPTVLLRAELDALPVEEKTGLRFASKVKAVDEDGKTVPVMHACGHDVHMTALVGAATLLVRAKDRWRGTVVFIGQPAEEKVLGARAMLADGLFKRFPRPDHAIAIHDSDDLAAGTVTYTEGFVMAHSTSVDVTIYGRGGHGAAPHTTVDPVVVAARTILALQTIVSREVDPRDPAVVTVGSVRAGNVHNVIPDEARLQLTVRSLSDETHEQILAAIRRIVLAEARAAGAPKEPRVDVRKGVKSTYNDPALTRRVAAALVRTLGKANVIPGRPAMVAEDFSEFGRAGVPSLLLRVGAVEPRRFAAAKKKGTPLPSLHSPFFAPDRQRTIRTGVSVLTLAALELLGKP